MDFEKIEEILKEAASQIKESGAMQGYFHLRLELSQMFRPELTKQ